jgi:membrane dipeptidase
VKSAAATSYRDLTADQERRAISLQQSCLVIDAIASSIVKPDPPVIDGNSYIDRALAAGVNVVNVTLAAHSDDFDALIHRIYDYLNLLDAKPESTLHVERPTDIHRAKEQGKLGIIFGIQTGTVVGTDMALWSIIHKLGVRIAQLTYNERNALGDGCMEPDDRGLTSYGRQSVQEMNRLGICVDLSHVGEKTSLDATRYSTKPVIYSHANPKAVGPGKRNITDQQMKDMAATGGVMGISAHSMLCHKTPGVQPTVDDMMDMFDYAIDLIGIDHVAIGSDVYESFTKLSWESMTKRWYPTGFVFETMRAQGFSAVSEFPNVTRGLVSRGYSDEEIAKVLGGNWLRLFGEVWAA